MDLSGTPPGDGGAGVEERFEKPDHAGVVDPDAREPHGSNRDRQRQPLQQREIGVNVQTLRLEGGEAAGYRHNFGPDRSQISLLLLQPEIGQVVGAHPVAQEG